MAEHIINEVADNSIADKLDICAGDVLISLNGEEIEDIFDYQYQCENDSVDMEIKKSDGSVITHTDCSPSISLFIR